MGTVVRPIYPEKVTFSALHVPVGTSLTLEAAKFSQKAQVELIGYHSDRGIIVSLPSGPILDTFDEGVLFKAKFLSKTGVVHFGTRVLKVGLEPFPHVFLTYPDAVDVRKVRSSERIPTTINANIGNDFSLDIAWPKEGIIEDLSKTGAKIRCRDRLGEFGHALSLDFDLNLNDMNRKVGLSAIIRNAHVDSEVIGEPHFVFGVQFLELNEDARLSLNNFIYERC